MLMTNNTTYRTRECFLRFSDTLISASQQADKMYCPVYNTTSTRTAHMFYILHFFPVNADIQYCTTKHMVSATFCKADFPTSIYRKQERLQVKRFSTILCEYTHPFVHENEPCNAFALLYRLLLLSDLYSYLSKTANEDF